MVYIQEVWRDHHTQDVAWWLWVYPSSSEDTLTLGGGMQHLAAAAAQRSAVLGGGKLREQRSVRSSDPCVAEEGPTRVVRSIAAGAGQKRA